MENETFREIGFWGCVGSAALGVINIIICFIKGVKIFNTTLEGSISSLFMYPADEYFETVLYKIIIIILFLALLMMRVSYLINKDGFSKILMVICTGIQCICVVSGLIGYFKESFPFTRSCLLCFIVIQLIALLLHMIDRDHRKTIIRVVVLAIIAAAGGLVYGLFLALLTLWLVVMALLLLLSVFGIFVKSEPQNVIYDASGKIVGFWKRE